MIYTVTLNPSIDYLVEVESFKMGKVNRTSYDAKFPGGKGINVSRMLKRLGNSTTALGFIGGQTGEFVKRFLRQEEIFTDFTEITGDTRINIKLKTGLETEINSQGPVISKGDYQQLFSQIEQLKNNDILILSGSIPPSVPSDVYEAMAKSCSDNGIKVVVDTSGRELLSVLPYRPFLIKPNHHELGELFLLKLERLMMLSNTVLNWFNQERKTLSFQWQDRVLCFAPVVSHIPLMCQKGKSSTQWVPVIRWWPVSSGHMKRQRIFYLLSDSVLQQEVLQPFHQILVHWIKSKSYYRKLISIN